MRGREKGEEEEGEGGRERKGREEEEKEGREEDKRKERRREGEEKEGREEDKRKERRREEREDSRTDVYQGAEHAFLTVMSVKTTSVATTTTVAMSPSFTPAVANTWVL